VTQIALWLPSQKGGVLVCLQAQKNLRPVSSAVHLSGVKEEPLWLPSQNGCFLELPQVAPPVILAGLDFDRDGGLLGDGGFGHGMLLIR